MNSESSGYKGQILGNVSVRQRVLFMKHLDWWLEPFK
jgi:hypothetical protein